jgi:hypothetical protein
LEIYEGGDPPCQYFEHKRYCIDLELGTDTLIGSYEISHAAKANLVPCRLCHPARNSQELTYVLSSGIAISIVCLTTTVIIFLVVKRFGDLIGKSLLMISLFMLLQYCCYIFKYSSDKYEAAISKSITWSVHSKRILVFLQKQSSDTRLSALSIGTRPCGATSFTVCGECWIRDQYQKDVKALLLIGCTCHIISTGKSVSNGSVSLA